MIDLVLARKLEILAAHGDMLEGIQLCRQAGFSSAEARQVWAHACNSLDWGALHLADGPVHKPKPRNMWALALKGMPICWGTKAEMQGAGPLLARCLGRTLSLRPLQGEPPETLILPRMGVSVSSGE